MAESVDLATLHITVSTKDVKDGISSLDGLSSAAGRAERSVGNLSTSASALTSAARQMITQIMAVVGAYKALEAATAFMGRGMNFNASMEGSQIGIASIVATMADIRNAQGDALEGQEKYNAAMEISARLMQRIQILGLQTTATSQELVEGVQNIIAPALQAGISLDKLPGFAVQAAQAMQTMGLPLQQMRTEIEALLTGNINKAQDQLAPRLGITSDTIAQWKAQGVLVENLEKRLAMFATAGKDVANTLVGLKSNASEALDIISGKMTSGFTESFKQVLREIQDLLISTEGNVGIGEDFKNIQRVLEDTSDILGDKFLGGAHSAIEAVKELNAALANVDTHQEWSDAGQAIKEYGAAIIAATVAFKALGVVKAVASSETVKSIQLATQETSAMKAMAQSHALDANARKQAALAALQKARAEETEASFIGKKIGGAAQQEAAFRRLVVAEKAYTAACFEAAEANNILSAAMSKTGVAAAGGTAWTKTTNATKTAFGGLVGMLGGPWIAALTVATGAVGYLATQESAAEKFARSHADALNMVSGNADTAANAMKDYADKLNAMTEKQRAFEVARLQKSQSDMLADLNPQRIARGFSSFFASGEDIEYLAAQFNNLLPKNFASTTLPQIDALIDKARSFGTETGKIEFTEELLKMLERLKANKIAFDETSGKTINFGGAMAGAAQKTGDAARAVGLLNDNLNAFDPKRIQGVLEGLEFEAYAKNLDGVQKAQAQAMRNAGVPLNHIQFAMSGQQGPLPGEIYNLKDAAGRAYTPPKNGSDSASKIKSALEQVARLREEADKLNGVSSSSSNSLAQKMREIAKTGADAKLSIGEITALQAEYQKGFQTDALRDFDKQLASIQGNTQKLREIEISSQVKEWESRFKAAGMGAEEATSRIDQLKAALEKQAQYKDLQAAVSFYDELARLSGNYEISLAKQNELITLKGEIHRQNGIPPDLVAEWELLQKLEKARDPLSGSVRGLRKFSSEAGDLAKGFENVFTTSFQNASDALTDFVMGADVDLNKLGNSFVRMFAQIAAQQAMGGIASGLGSLLGNALGGWLGGGSSVSTGIGSSGWTGGGGGGWATGGWDSGMGLAASADIFHSGGLVGMGGASDRALPFSVFEHAPRFHNGGGYFREDEYPAVLQYGERVLNRRDTAVFDAAMSLSRAPMPAMREPVAAAPIINVYNTAKGTEARAEAQQQPDGSFKIDVIVEEVDRRMAQRVTSGTSHTARAMDSTRGMSPAPAAYRG